MKLLRRSHCAVTGRKDLSSLHRFPKFPVFMGCVRQSPARDLFAPMDWRISRSSGLIQLGRLLPLSVLYASSHGSGSVGLLWNQHHEAFARFICKSCPPSVFEIGGGHGILAKKYHQFAAIPWTILEPNPSPCPESPAKYVRGFFDKEFKFPGEFGAVVHSHVFEHMYDPAGFMRDLAAFIPAGIPLFFSIPNLEVMLRRKYTNCINFEHTIFLSEPYVRYLLSTHGFKVVRKKLFRADHSIFFHAIRTELPVNPCPLPRGLYSRHRQMYGAYVRFHKKLVTQLNRRLKKISQPIYLFGAHVFSQYLVVFGLNTGRIRAVLDNDPEKQGKRLYGTALRVESPRILARESDPWVILRAGVYNREIRDQISKTINPRTRFL